MWQHLIGKYYMDLQRSNFYLEVWWGLKRNFSRGLGTKEMILLRKIISQIVVKQPQSEIYMLFNDMNLQNSHLETLQIRNSSDFVFVVWREGRKHGDTIVEENDLVGSLSSQRLI